ncbi:MAG: SgcJ/EcaC family oxidoreductase [Acidobacteriaceae bacterium]|nr:SgcJ/EcaC family oxidoreductase [Acidobacteriaceae bacterium]
MPSRVILLLITSGCVAINLNAAQSSYEISIREILRLQTEAWNRGDGIEWAREFTDDCDFVNMRGDTLHGRSEIVARITASLQSRMKGSHLSLSIRQLNSLTPDIVLVETDYEFTGLPGSLPGIAPTAEGVLKTRMKYVAVRREHWYFIAAQNTPVLPPLPKR